MIYDDRPESIIESSYERHMKPKILFIPRTPADTYHKNIFAFSSSNVVNFCPKLLAYYVNYVNIKNTCFYVMMIRSNIDIMHHAMKFDRCDTHS